MKVPSRLLKTSPRLRVANAALVTLVLLGCAAAAWFYGQGQSVSGDVAFSVAMAATVMRVVTHLAAQTVQDAEEP